MFNRLSLTKIQPVNWLMVKKYNRLRPVQMKILKFKFSLLPFKFSLLDLPEKIQVPV